MPSFQAAKKPSIILLVELRMRKSLKFRNHTHVLQTPIIGDRPKWNMVLKVSPDRFRSLLEAAHKPGSRLGVLVGRTGTNLSSKRGRVICPRMEGNEVVQVQVAPSRLIDDVE